MAAPNGESQLNGSALAQDLFEDMRRQVDNVQSQERGEDNTEQRVVEEIESLCMNCHEDGVTRLLLTRIPFFREIVVMSFACEACGFKNAEIQSAGQIQERGTRYAFKVESETDMQRQVVKSDTCTFKIEDLDLEIPMGKGRYTNVEGLISSVRDDLASHQDARMEQMPEVGRQVAGVIQRLSDMISGSAFPFVVSADDPSGNSWIEPSTSDSVGKYTKSSYPRDSTQNALLGIGDDVPNPDAPSGDNTASAPDTAIRPEYHSANLVGSGTTPSQAATNNVDAPDIVENQVYTFPASCPACTRPCDTHMKMVSIPYFKQVVLMSTVCDSCGYRSNEVKTGGEVPDKGQRITLRVEKAEDLARDILKSESAALSCPELQLRVEPGTLGGRFTTVEGLLTQMRKDLRAQAFDLKDGDEDVAQGGDSMPSETKRTWNEFFEGLKDAIEGRKPFTVILEDPLAGSYVQSLTAPEKDPQIDIENYVRTAEEEEHLGLSDMKTEGYEVAGEDPVSGGELNGSGEGQ